MEKEICECKRDYKSPLSGICELCWDEKFPDEKETLEDSKKSFGEIWSSLTTEQSEYLKGYINRRIEDAKKWQAERMYSEEEVQELLIKALTYKDNGDVGNLVTIQNEIRTANFYNWFEQFKKK